MMRAALSETIAKPYIVPSSFKVQFSMALLPQRLSVSCDSDNTANIAYMGLEVKLRRKSPYFRTFSEFVFRIKKFSSPKKMRNRQFVFTPKIEYELVAERPVVSSVEPSEANLSSLQFPTWCPRQESNLDIGFRKPVFCPLNYGGSTIILYPRITVWSTTQRRYLGCRTSPKI